MGLLNIDESYMGLLSAEEVLGQAGHNILTPDWKAVEGPAT